MEEKKKNPLNKFFGNLLLILLIFFTALYIAGSAGYYEYELHKKVVLTEDKIKEFEEDVNDGKNIDVKNYLIEKELDYSNKISNIGLSFSESIGEIVKGGLEKTFNFLNQFME